MKKKIFQTGLALLLSLALIPACKEDIANAEDNKISKQNKYLKDNYTTCNLMLDDLLYLPNGDLSDSRYGIGYEFIPANDKQDSIKIGGDSITCSHFNYSYTWYRSAYKKSTEQISAKFILDKDRMVFKSISMLKESTWDNKELNGNTNQGNIIRKFYLLNVPFETDKDSNIVANISGQTLKTMIQEFKMNDNEEWEIRDSVMLKISIK